MIITLQTLIFFRQTVLNVLDRILRSYYNKLSLTFGKKSDISEEEEPEDQVFSEFDDEKGVVFYPRVFLQRYAAVSDCLLDERWSGKLHKVVELGYHDLSFIKYLKEVPGIGCILAVDIESAPLHCSTDLVGCEDYGPKRDSPLQITLFQGNAADPDYRLIGCDAVIGIEMIEHMLPHDLERLIHTVFGFIKPWIVIFTTPNADFNVLFKSLEKNGLRRLDHYFEWTRDQFHDWCSNIVNRYENYTVTCKGIGPGPPGTIHLGCCSQMALFISKNYNKQQDLTIDSLALVSGNARDPEISNLIGTWDKSDLPSDSNTLFPPDKLNCTSIHVKSFSKTTQNILNKNKDMALMHTREVVDEIRYLAKMLNFNKDSVALETLGNCVQHWRNINWGVDAPYWNQYYKVVKEYNPPYEVGLVSRINRNLGPDNSTTAEECSTKSLSQIKSEECRITELISDEINRLIDCQYNDVDIDLNRLEIPLEQLIPVVSHITKDVEKIKDLLEWDGYEIVDNLVIHSRIVVDTASTRLTNDDDWLENETYSDVKYYL